METHSKKRIEVVIEAPALPRLLKLFERHDVRGHTVMPAIAGVGAHGEWSREGLVGEAGRMIVVLTILDAAALEPMMDELLALLERQIGVVAITDCEVLRGSGF